MCDRSARGQPLKGERGALPGSPIMFSGAHFTGRPPTLTSISVARVQIDAASLESDLAIISNFEMHKPFSASIS